MNHLELKAGTIKSDMKALKKWFDTRYRGKPVELKIKGANFYILMFKSYDELLKHIEN